MKKARLLRALLAGFAVVAAAAHPVAAAAEPAGSGLATRPDALMLWLRWTDELLAQRKHRWENGLQTEARTSIERNVFALGRKDLDAFHEKNDPGERFEGLKSPEDRITTLAFEHRWSLLERKTTRVLDFTAGAATVKHFNNDVSDYREARARVRWWWGPRDRFGFGLKLRPKHFRANYKPLGVKPYLPAHARQHEVSLEYQKRWTGRTTSTIEVGLDARRYGDPFGHLDTDGWSAELGANLELTTSIAIQTTLGLGAKHVAPVPESIGSGKNKRDLLVDRSTTERRARLGAEMDWSGGWSTGIGLGIRQALYDSRVAGDKERYGRSDLRIAGTLGIKRKVSEALEFTVEISWVRQDVSLPGEFTGDEPGEFEALAAEFGLRFHFY